MQADTMMNRPSASVFGGLLLAVSSATPGAQPRLSGQDLTGTIRIVGTDTMKDLMDRWIAAFTRLHPGVHIQVNARGALTAAPALADGTADIAPLGREFTPAEIDAFRNRHGYDPTAIAVALGSYDTSGKTVALGFFVNSANPIDRLSFQQLDAMYCISLRRGAAAPITTWGELGLTGQWSDRAIRTVGVNFPDGISNFIRLRICRDGVFRPDIREEHTGGAINVLERIVRDVAADPAAIGYAGFANLQAGSKLIRVSEDSGHYLTGTRDEVAQARYPLTRFIYLFVDVPPGHALPEPQGGFLRFVLSSEGQALVDSDAIYMPLPASAVLAEKAKVR